MDKILRGSSPPLNLSHAVLLYLCFVLLSAGPAAYIMIGRRKNFFEKYLDGTYMQKQSAQIYKVDVNMLNLSLF